MDNKIFSKNNKYLMLALDHRESFKKTIESNLKQSVTDQQIIEIKKKIIEPVINQASGILIDPGYGLPAYQQIIQKNNSPIPYLLCTEKSGYQDKAEQGRFSELQYSASQLKEMGASGVKLLLYFNPLDQAAEHQLKIGQQALIDAHAQRLPIFIEIVTYQTEGQSQSTEDLVINSIELFKKNQVIPDVWKLEYPGNIEACKKITQLVKPVPWILLTRGVGYDLFKNQMKDAADSGAIGFLAGRALWQEALELTGSPLDVFLNDVYPQRFQEISNLVK